MGHDYSDLIEENDGENGLAAHYECTVCHKLFDTDYNEVTLEDLQLDEEPNVSDDPSVNDNPTSGDDPTNVNDP